ncbi:hypothetical protein Micbo1qcDRAFT_232968 [Microdochium bolleyi]|uniref:Uncharacterized protein n=1 Tax=Microdochium bolleyi TaxID=196109 RepID=A0A136J8J8_9PEZI|nr:hypothetical protein Micbo1qcDRAFT_232968 [Microdochium bolleyi]
MPSPQKRNKKEPTASASGAGASPSPSIEDIANSGDVILVVGRGSSIIKLRVYSQCLKASSKVFDAMFSIRWLDGKELSEQEPKEFTLPDDDPETKRKICYQLHFKKTSMSSAHDMLQVAIHADKSSHLAMSRSLRQALFHGRSPRQLLPAASTLTTKLPSTPSPAASTLPASSRSRRCLSTTRNLAKSSSSATSAKEAAAHLLSTLSGVTTTRKQLIDGNQLQRLSLTLGRRYLYPEQANLTNPEYDLTNLNSVPHAGTPVPPGYHLAYFTPGGLESELGPDGTDRTFNAPAPFTRRMWAGGRMTWYGPAESGGPTLSVGQIAEERTRLVGATAKKSRDGSEMVLVDVEKEFWCGGARVLTDRRSWIFRPELEAASSTEEIATETSVIRGPSTVRDVTLDGKAFSPASSIANHEELKDLPRRLHRWSPAGLFRFSALTFNGHRIHYDQPWSRAIENHPSPSVVVHGPLNLICMLDYWRDVVAEHGAVPGSPYYGNATAREHEEALGVREIEYRALSPLYAGQEYSIRAERVDEGLSEEQQGQFDREGFVDDGPGQVWELFVEREGKVCMKGKITTFGP